MFKVGDVVRRKKDEQDSSWRFGNSPVTITAIASAEIRIKEDSDHWHWYIAEYFDLVKSYNQYPCIKEIPLQEVRREIQFGKLLESTFFTISPSDLNDNRVIIKDQSVGVYFNHYLSEQELRDTAAAFIAVADVLKENSRG